eukprot:7356066-Ditylum_brightwellii.AAC.1
MGLPGTKTVFIGLVDSGVSRTLFSQQLANQCVGKVDKSNKKWTTQGGQYATTKQKKDVLFTLPLFTTHRVIKK